MADATNQVRPVQTVAQTDTGTTFDSESALSRQCGGTGASVSTVADLLTHLGRGAANGFASLDASTLVPAAQLTAMVGTDGSANGTKGAVPVPAGTGTPGTSDTLRPLRGDGTWGGGANDVSRVWLTDVTDESGVVALAIERDASATANPFVQSTSTGQNVRVGAQSATLSDVDCQIEPLGFGRVTSKGDGFLQCIKPPRFVVAKAFGATLDTVGLADVTVTTPGASAVSFDDADGVYVWTENETIAARTCGFSIPTVTKRRLQPEMIIVFRTPLLRSRIWVGMFDSDPSAWTSLPEGTGGIAGAGFFYDSAIGQPNTGDDLVNIAVDGTANTFTRTSGSFLADGFRAGQDATWTGLSNAGNNGTFPIVSVTATVMTVTDAGGVLVNESSGTSTTAKCVGSASVFWRAVTANGGTSASDQTETVTTLIPTANAWTCFRIRNLGPNNWEYSVYDSSQTVTGQFWTVLATHTTNDPGVGTALGFYCTNRQIRGATAAGPSITIAAAGKTFTRASGSWYDDGFKIGDNVTVSGCVASSGANNVTASITDMTETVLTFGAATLVDEGPITTAALKTANSSMALSTMSLLQD